MFGATTFSENERKAGDFRRVNDGLNATPLGRPNPSTIPLESLSDEEVKNLANDILDREYVAGPIFHSINKKLASIYLSENQEQQAIFHLAESHGCSLRHQAYYRYSRLLTNEKASNEDRGLANNLLECVEFGGKYSTDKFQGLCSRLEELPSEWSIVQLSIQYDPMLRITLSPTRKHNPMHVTRMSCGNLVTKANSHKQGGSPLSVLVSPSSDCSDVLDIVTTLKDTLETHRLETHRSAKSSLASSNYTIQFSSKLKCFIKDFEQMLGDTRCILPGNLVDTKLHKSICRKVDKIVKSIAGSDEISKFQQQILYLLATAPFKLRSEESVLLNTVMTNRFLREKLFKAILELHEEHRSELASAERHPVIMVLDELLDIFPIEMIDALKRHPVTRVPSIHFAHALYREHSQTIFRSGVSGEVGYYIINPAGDLKKCEKSFRDFFQNYPEWTGVMGVPPTSPQFIEALSKKPIFVYCGHGGGNQYSDVSDIERIRVKAIAFLIGCSSLTILPLGGRVEGYSIFNSYTIGGCPCSVGMLWDVTDTDANVMTEYLLKECLKPQKSSKAGTVNDICKRVQDLKVQDDETKHCELARLLPSARGLATHLRNSAALVIRGLPVNICR